jgi:hypothetical protein
MHRFEEYGFESAIFVEEDLIFAPDFLAYFRSTYWFTCPAHHAMHSSLVDSMVFLLCPPAFLMPEATDVVVQAILKHVFGNRQPCDTFHTCQSHR